ncbi:DHA2 family efflux MFS transporter permease subunit [Corynebacterium bovis]|uniref:DHA2 family efflux MFS transporter permease subunit n=1 Tax=Corynebacterium bovis TaxID=36808 RepID=UPI00163A2CA9|nr:DHA2 family efflux MFS transporter permease subunit [Corynebacterium bovis]MDN8579798.1 DHA2 family efflux MFS transporter permease subunit [Corynebacterium bovis]
MPTPDHDRGPTTTPDAGAPAARPASPGDVPPMPPATRLLIGILVAAAFVVILNETTLSVAMPVIMDQFAVTPGAAQWLTTGFMVTTAVVIPLTGWILQRFSTRAVYIAALTIFLAGTLVAAFAPVFAVLLLGRIVQAVGTALVMPLLMTTIIELVPMERRGSVFGLMSVVIAAAPALGPTVSGLILEGLGWRWIFGVMTPLIVIMLVVGAVLVKNVGQAGRPVLDVPSVGLSAVGFAAALYGLSGLGEIAQGAAPFVPVGTLVVGLVVLAVFVRRQERLRRGGRSPLLNLEPMRIREFVLSLVLLLLAFGMLFGFIILMPLFAQDVMGLSQFTTGLTTLPGGVVMAVTGPLVGRAFDVRGTRPLIIPGAACLTVAMVGLALMTESTSAWYLTGVTVILNLGVGLVMTPLMSNALAAVPERIASHGSAIVNTFQQVAKAAGATVLVAVMGIGSALAAGPGAGPRETLSAGIHVAFITAAVVSVALLVATVVLRLDVVDHRRDADRVGD